VLHLTGTEWTSAGATAVAESSSLCVPAPSGEAGRSTPGEVEAKSRPAASLRARAHVAVATQDVPYRMVGVEPTVQPDNGVILGGRATSVPLTAVLIGAQRTATDNTRTASTCAFPYLRR
jgi:hypothetical protein